MTNHLSAVFFIKFASDIDDGPPCPQVSGHLHSQHNDDGQADLVSDVICVFIGKGVTRGSNMSDVIFVLLVRVLLGA